ncbi:cation diffusion facilitator family transporter [Rothia kristinae]|uniref:Cation diffusion facilitator family transporter n=1 Tax=Rothia kristinae TaxID=37923 RepID=A0A1S2MYU5_9MICC|nr:cation diffusion facilitator family transporter [Rothia kristinae]OIJ35084.1 cation transporter [Rothia kristinae]QPT53126.1 cation diffusion facilitator family transporter [Rothia kristinae]QQC59880.1 cation diffusion facilitator family transporter [Rothia kristinae]
MTEKQQQEPQQKQQRKSSGGAAIFAALAANLGIAVLKFAAYLLTRSSSMLAESIHSVADTGNQFLLLLGGRAARKAPDAEHPFGHGQNRYIYAFVVSIVMFSLGGLFSLYEAWEKWAEPHPIEDWAWVPVVVLVGSILMEGRSLLTALRQARGTKGQRSWLEYVRGAKAPELPVVMLEDSAAVTGLLFALFGITMTLITGDGRWDAAGSGAIGVLLVAVAVFLAVEMKSLLLGESASASTLETIRRAVDAEEHIGLIHLKTMHLAPEQILVAAKISVARQETAAQLVAEINATERRIREAVPAAQLIYLEPDLYREDYVSEIPPQPEQDEA